MIPLVEGAYGSGNSLILIKGLRPGTLIRPLTAVSFAGNCASHPIMYTYSVVNYSMADNYGYARIKLICGSLGIIANNARVYFGRWDTSKHRCEVINCEEAQGFTCE